MHLYKYCLFSFLLCSALFSKAQEAYFDWVIPIGDADRNGAYSLTIDQNGYSYTTVSFTGTLDADPGSGTLNLTSNGSGDIALLKHNKNGALVWAKSIGGPYFDFARLCLDKSGNILLTGGFHSTVDFDPGPGVSSLTSNGRYDVFVLKLDTAGNFIWVKHLMGGRKDEMPTAIYADDTGNIYSTGTFKDSIDLDPGPSSYKINAVAQDDAYISKLSPDGDFLWGGHVRGNSYEIVTDLAANSQGDIYITGRFEGRADLDPGPGVMNRSSTGSYDAFLSKLSPQGNLLWTRTFGGTGFESGSSIALDAQENIYLCGFFGSTADYDPGPGSLLWTLADDHYRNAFLMKFSPLGDLVWGRRTDGYSASYNSIHTSNGYVYTAGGFRDTLRIATPVDTIEVQSSGESDIFFTSHDTNGNLNWVKRIGGGASSNYASAITLDPKENIYLFGGFEGTSDFDPDDSTAYTLTPKGINDAFLLKLSQPYFSLSPPSSLLSLAVYPNPSTASVNVSLASKCSHITARVFDLSGREYSFWHFRKTAHFSLMLPDRGGLYLLVIETEKGTVTRRVIKL